MKKIKILLILVLSCLAYYVHAQVLFNVRQLSNCNEFQVSLTPNTTYFTPFNLTNGAQVTLVVPTGSVSVNSLTSITGNWVFISPIITAPAENPFFDYINFQLTNGTSAINYQAGVEVPLFTINTTRNCGAGNVVLIDNADPFIFPNSLNINVGNFITVFGAGGNAYSGNYDVGGGNSGNTTNNPTTSNECIIEYQISEVGSNLFQVSLIPDTTWTGINAITSTAQVSIRVPTGTLNIGNLTNNIPTAIWTLNSSHISPPENPAWDYYSFGLQNTQDITYNKGIPVDLFRFENFGVCPSSIVLIDNDTDLLMQPNSQNANVEQQITISGWKMPDAPVCIAGSIIPTCPPTNPLPADDCLINYHLSSAGGNLFQVSLTPDTTWTGINAFTATGQVSIRVPTGSFVMGNLTNNIPTAVWTLNSSHISPPENPAWDYYSFGLEFTQDIPYFDGVEVDLFQFENLGTCTGNNIYLIDNATDPLMQPNSQNANIEQQLTVSGWQMEDVPICIDAGTSVACCNCGSPPPPSTNMFSATRECMGDATHFTCPINGNVINSVLWDFGDGIGASTLKNPSYIYQEHGTYSVTLRINYSNGTSSVFTQDVIVDPMIWPLVRAMKDTVCIGECVRLQAQGGDFYAWSPTATIDDPAFFSPVVCPTTTTTYSVIISDDLGCSATEDVTIYVSNPSLIQTINDISVCKGEPATLGIASGSGEFQWGPVGTIVNGTIANAIANPTSTTEYCVTVTDALGCTASDCMIVTVLPDPVVSAGADQEICTGETAQLNSTGGINYQWSPATNITNTAIPNPIVSPTTTTEYCVTVTDNNGCTSTDCVTITVNEIATVISNDATICAGQSTLLSITGGTSYSWSPSAGLSSSSISNPTASPIASTTYCVTITNAAGCTQVQCTRVNVNAMVTANAGQNVTICKDQPTQLFASGGNTYVWSPTTNLSSTSIANPIASPSITTTYCVTATDSNGCTDTDCVEVIVENNLTANAGQDQSLCRGENVVLNASGGSTYSWSPSNGLSNTTVPNPVATPTTTTTYCVTVTDKDGCVDTDCVNIIIEGTIVANAGSDITLCSGNTSQLTASGGTTYRWSPAIGLSNTNIANPIVTANNTTTYCVTVTDASGCEASDCVNIIVENGITANAGNDVSICSDGIAQLVASGGISYQWSPTAGLNNSNINNPIASPSSSTNYCVTVTDNNGCTGTDCVRVDVSNSINANAGNDINTCSGSSTSLNASGGSTYRWAPTAGLSNPNIPNPIVSVNTATTYCVTVTDNNGCTGTDCLSVNIGENVIPNAGADQNICIGSIVSLNASGGSTYRWFPTSGLSNPNIANPTVNVSVPTTYCVTVMEDGKCSQVDCVVININGNITANAGSDISICSGSTTSLNASGGSTYRWSPTAGLSNPNIANPSVNISTPTTYCVTVTDNTGCTGIDCVNVSIGTGVKASAGSDISVCIGNSSVLNASGGTSYQWSPTTGLNNPNIASPTVTPTLSTLYCVTVSDANGCTAQDCVSVSTKKIQSNISNNVTICEGKNTQLIATGGDFYSWTPTTGLSNPNIANPFASPTSTITYCVNISAEDCSKQECVTVIVINCDGESDDENVPNICNPSVNAVACPDKNICIGEEAQLVVNGGNTWSWSPTTSINNPFTESPIATPTVTTIYTVTVTDINGCTDTDQVTVFVDNCEVTLGPCSNGSTVVACDDKTICPGETVQLVVTTGLTYQWLPLTNLSNPFSGVPFASPTTTTTYSVTVTDINGCIGVDEVTVFVSSDCSTESSPQLCTTPALVITCEDKYICRGESIRLNVTTGTSYEWSPDASLSHPNVGAPIARPLATTTYTVTVTDTDGCIGTDEVTVFVNDAQASAGTDVSTCGSAVQLNASGGNTYSWSPSTGLSNASIANPIANPSNTTIYCVTITDLDGCTDTDCVAVSVGSSFPAVACEDKSICQGENVTLTVTTGSSYRWSPSTGLSNPNIGTPIASPSQSTTYVVTVTDEFGCTSVDEVVVNVDPNCSKGRSCPEDILPSDSLTIELSDCELSGELCLPIARASVSNYIFKINGVEQTEDAFKDCQLNYSFSYTYFTIPDRGKNGPYNLQEWIVDGNIHEGSFESIEELIRLMNSIDPDGNWTADESTLTLKGGHPDIKYSTISIEQIASNATAKLELNTNITPSETIIILPIGTNEVEIMLKETGCKVLSTIQVACPNDCADLFMDDRIERELTDCKDLVEVCLEFPLLNAIEYSYLHNGGPFQGDGGFCSLNGTTTALYVGKGEHELIVTHLVTGCSDTLIVIATCLESITGELEPSADTDEAITNVNEPIAIDVSANDRSLGTIQSMQIISPPNKGQVFINEDQSISYQPNEDYCDSKIGDKFSYEICNEHGCDIAEVLVKVACKPLSVHNGFSPNGDGINDYFKIEGVEEYPNSTLQVFNRWGALIYQQKAYQNDWNGQYKSNPLADGVYFYLFTDGYGNKQSGYIQISR